MTGRGLRRCAVGKPSSAELAFQSTRSWVGRQTMTMSEPKVFLAMSLSSGGMA